MFEAIADYMKKTLVERQSHFDLSEPCIELGTSYSREYRGLLAHFLRTMLPTKKEAVLCHGCHNNACSNPRHLYWGTYSENLRDAISSGANHGFRGNTVKKHGREKADEIARSNFAKARAAKKSRREAAGVAARLSNEREGFDSPTTRQIR